MIKIHIKKTCRLCGSKEINKLFTLCKSPLANNLANSVKTSIVSKKIPLVLMFCTKCNHIQLQHVVNKKHLFSNYFYMTGISNQFRIHFKKYSEKVIKKLNKQNQVKVFEIGSNDCTLLDYFKKKKCITVGVEPALNLYKKTKKNHEIFNCFYNNPIPGIYTLGGGPENMISLIESIEIIKKITKKDIKPIYSDERFGDLHYFVANYSKFTKATGWMPKINPSEGINRLIKWVKNNKDLFYAEPK